MAFLCISFENGEIFGANLGPGSVRTVILVLGMGNSLLPLSDSSDGPELMKLGGKIILPRDSHCRRRDDATLNVVKSNL